MEPSVAEIEMFLVMLCYEIFHQLDIVLCKMFSIVMPNLRVNCSFESILRVSNEVP